MKNWERWVNAYLHREEQTLKDQINTNPDLTIKQPC